MATFGPELLFHSELHSISLVFFLPFFCLKLISVAVELLVFFFFSQTLRLLIQLRGSNSLSSEVNIINGLISCFVQFLNCFD